VQQARVNFALSLTAVALVGLALYVRHGGQEHVPLVPATPETVHTLHIERAGKPPILLRRDTRWQMLEPYALPADFTRIEALLRALREMTYTRIDGDGDGDYGLDAPAAQLHLDGEPLVLAGSNPLDLRRYLRYRDQTYLAEDLVMPLLDSQVLFFADHQLLPPGFRPVSMDYAGSRTPLRATTATAWMDARAILLQPYDGDVTALSMLRLLDAAGRELVFAIPRSGSARQLVRTDLAVEYQLPARMAEQLLPDAAGEE